ncbi:MAG: septum formation initiator family protein, partial [Alphaproteobacteria bacterium]|nr:septum formation initiator family protein [Alphaproteobacteria bacterium]
MFALTLYGVSGGITGYFVWHAINGDRGLKAKEAYRTEMRAISQTRQTLQNEYDRLARRIA